MKNYFKKMAALWVVGCLAAVGVFAEGEGTWKVSGFVNAGVDVGITSGDAEGFVTNNEDYDGDSHTTATVTYEKGPVTASGKIVLDKSGNDYTFNDSDLNIAVKVGDLKGYVGGNGDGVYAGAAYDAAGKYGAEAKFGLNNSGGNLLDWSTYTGKSSSTDARARLKQATGYFNLPLGGGTFSIKSGTGNYISLEGWNTPGPFEFQAGEDDDYDADWKGSTSANSSVGARVGLFLNDVVKGLSLGIVTRDYDNIDESLRDFRHGLTVGAKFATGPVVATAGYGYKAASGQTSLTNGGDILYAGASFNAGPVTAMADFGLFGLDADLTGENSFKDTSAANLGFKVAFSSKDDGKGKIGADASLKLVNLIHDESNVEQKDGTVVIPVNVKYFVTNSALAKLGLEFGLGTGDNSKENTANGSTWKGANYFQIKPQFYFFPGQTATDDIDNDVAKTGFYVALPIKFGTAFADGLTDEQKAPTVALQLRLHWAF